MTIIFNLPYRTNHGEELVVNILSGVEGKIPSRHKMSTMDNYNHTCRINVKPLVGEGITYCYSLDKNGFEARREWQVVPHLIKFLSPNSGKCTVYDNWIDIPADSYMYSSAVTDCVARRDINNDPHAGKGIIKPGRFGSVIIKVRAPQLRGNERLAILGSIAQLGNWEALKAYPMREQAPNEWVAVLDGAAISGQHFEYKFVALDESKDYTPLWEDRMNRHITIPQIKEGENVVYEMGAAYFQIYPLKAAGTVIPIFSLKSEGSFGVGDFGDLKKFIDWAAKTSQRVIQILPIYDTTITHTWKDSYPYNSISIYALHPQYADLRQLPMLKDDARRNYYENLRKELNALSQIDYERVNNVKREYLHELYVQEYHTFPRRATYKQFFSKNQDWLVPYAAFCHYRDLYGTATFCEWPDHHTMPAKELKAMSTPGTKEYRQVAFWYYVQYILDTQLHEAHEYARKNSIVLKGDIPIGISRDGVEAWVEPKYFNLDGQAGAPPDAFSVNGQNWGFPTYNWDSMLKDGCSWWVRRFRKMAEFFDAYRIDHVLGFFRIWEIPIDAVHGLLGQFSPSLGMTAGEIEGYGFKFNEDRYTRPFITDWILDRIFKENAQAVKDTYLVRIDDERYSMKPEYDTQRKVEVAFKDKTDEKDLWLRDGLYSLISNVLFLKDKKDCKKFHPRIAVQLDFVYESLWDNDKRCFNNLYNDYFYRRNNQFWYQEAMKKLPRLAEATRMLVCAEDLGMVPSCVPWVMEQLRILSLEIQSMPKDENCRFGHLSRNPYKSVCTISTHDMPTLRQWWDEDPQQTQEYFNSMLYRSGAAPHPLPGWLAQDIVMRHLTSPSMLCLLSLQDWLAIDETLRFPDQNAERINIPANPRHYWRYRMHLTIEQLLEAEEFNSTITTLIKQSGRKL